MFTDYTKINFLLYICSNENCNTIIRRPIRAISQMVQIKGVPVCKQIETNWRPNAVQASIQNINRAAFATDLSEPEFVKFRNVLNSDNSFNSKNSGSDKKNDNKRQQNHHETTNSISGWNG